MVSKFGNLSMQEIWVGTSERTPDHPPVQALGEAEGCLGNPTRGGEENAIEKEVSKTIVQQF